MSQGVLFGEMTILKVRNTICPVTGGNQTRMSESSFRKLCGHYQAKARGENRSANDTGNYAYCRECKGSVLPAGLEFISPKP